MTLSTLGFTASYSTRLDEEPRVHKAQFNDGYAQRANMGINLNPQRWNVNFGLRTNQAALELCDFFRTLEGTTPFLWTNPEGDELRFVCVEWSRGFQALTSNDVSATFEQDFAP